jgi:hypothetical protein
MGELSVVGLFLRCNDLFNCDGDGVEEFGVIFEALRDYLEDVVFENNDFIEVGFVWYILWILLTNFNIFLNITNGSSNPIDKFNTRCDISL